MTDSQITLWGAVSLRALRVHWALHELALPYRCEPIQSRSGETLTEEYGRLNPKRKIPYLTDGDFGLSESAAIVGYLFRAYGAGRGVYLPADDRAQATSDEWCYFVMTEMDAHSLYLIRRHGHLPEVYGHAPAAVASAEEYFLKQLAAVTPRIAEADPYLFGDRLGAADILLTTCLDWAANYGIEVSAPALAYLERTKARPAYQAAVASNAVAGQ
ncbi:MAG: glutathione S-transferase family protein [Alphaproteobacteria bacterium]|jgi:glutathione S-transferase|nr:glutathione S-transferase family protein [Alphaproteobacteria bacterium]MDP6564673.1 glutathione S-transferase family protein [Alphaproteobacteria bacterium]MDP6816159.1 glutathione S-transferase family protein [Alphaproteobacteria bacterium]